MIQAKVELKGVPLNLLVRDLRYKVGLTQKEFAKRLGVSTILISMVETDQKNVTFKLLEKIAKYFKVKIELVVS